MTWWDWFWGHWWPTIGWGDAPAWVGSVLTSGSLFLAIVILYRDRRDRRFASANRFVTYLTLRPSGIAPGSPVRLYDVTIYAHNANDVPIQGAHVIFVDEQGVVQRRAIRFAGIEILPIEPRTTSSQVVQIPIEMSEDRIFAEFIDSDGRQWHRRISTRQYLSRRQILRALERQAKAG